MRDMNLLEPEFKSKVEALLAICSSKGVNLLVYYTLRSPQEQARLWKLSRTEDQIAKQILFFESKGCSFLAKCLKDAPFNWGKKVTNALPGYSWHNYGEAADLCVIDAQKKAVWNAKDKGYRIMAEEAVKLGLTAGYFFQSLPDAVHIQKQPYGSPSSAYTLEKINQIMQEKFSKW